NFTLDDGDYAIKIGKRAAFSPGVATVTNGSANVAWSSGTNFADVDSGDLFVTAAGNYNVASKTDSTHIVLTQTWGGSNGTTAYAMYLQPTAYIGTNFHPVEVQNLSLSYTGA